MRICKVEGCDKKHRATGYCIKHYRQMQRHGRILTRTQNDPNEIITSEDIAYVVLCGIYGKERDRAIIDTEDIKKIKNFKWSLAKTGYVQAHHGAGIIKIQHIVMGIFPNMEKQIDHKDGNRLNNCKSNLRFCTSAENNRNRGKQKNNKSGYKGVYHASRGSRWVANIRINRKTIYLGTFTNKLDAAKTYNEAAIKYHGEFACLNII